MNVINLNSFSNLSIHLIYFGKTINFKDHLNAFKYFFKLNKVKVYTNNPNNNALIEIYRIIKKSLSSNKPLIFITGPSYYDLILIFIASLLRIKTVYYAHEPNPLKIINFRNFIKRISILIYQLIIFRLCTQILPASLSCKSELKSFKNVYSGFVPLPFKKSSHQTQQIEKIYDYVFISRKLQLNKGFDGFLKFAKIYSSKKFLIHTSHKALKNLKDLSIEIPSNIYIETKNLNYQNLCNSLLRCKIAIVLPENTTQSSARSIFWNLGIPLITTPNGMKGFEQMNSITLIITLNELKKLRKNKVLQETIINFSSSQSSNKNLYYDFTDNAIKNFLQKNSVLF